MRYLLETPCLSPTLAPPDATSRVAVQKHCGQRTQILSLPDTTRVFTGHDYQPGGRDMQYMATVAEHKANNIHLQGDKTSFVQMRNERDATLNMPTLIFSLCKPTCALGRCHRLKKRNPLPQNSVNAV